MVLLGLLQSRLYLVDFLRRNPGSPLRLLLKSVQYINYTAKLDRVDRPVGAAIVVLDHLEHAGPVETPKRLGIGVLPAGLRVE